MRSVYNGAGFNKLSGSSRGKDHQHCTTLTHEQCDYKHMVSQKTLREIQNVAYLHSEIEAKIFCVPTLIYIPLYLHPCTSGVPSSRNSTLTVTNVT